MNIYKNKITIAIWFGILLTGFALIELLIDDYDTGGDVQISKQQRDGSNYANSIVWREKEKKGKLNILQSKEQREFNEIVKDTIYFAESTRRYEEASAMATEKLRNQIRTHKIDKWLFVVDDVKHNQKDPASKMNTHRDSFSIVSLHSVDKNGSQIINNNINLMTSKLLRISSNIYYSGLYKDLALIRVGDLVEVTGNFKSNVDLYFHSLGNRYGSQYSDYHKDMTFYIDIKTIKPLLTKEELLNI